MCEVHLYPYCLIVAGGPNVLLLHFFLRRMANIYFLKIIFLLYKRRHVVVRYLQQTMSNFLIRCEVLGQGCRMCTDCKAL